MPTTIPDFTTATDQAALDAMLAAITDGPTMRAAAVNFFNLFATDVEANGVFEQSVLAGLDAVDEHGRLPECFPSINERPPMLFGTILNPLSPVALAWKRDEPSKFTCRLIPTELRAAVNSILYRLDTLGG